MHCPKCNHPIYDPAGTCPNCQFGGNPAQLEELTHLKWLLTEIDTWSAAGISLNNREILQRKYLTRRRELEVSLGLRLPPFTAQEARQAWPELFQRQTLLQRMGEWLTAGLFKPESTLKMVEQASHQVDELLQQLEGHPRPAYPQTDTDRLNIINFLLDAIDYLRQNQSFVTPEAENQVCSPLLAEKENLEIKLGLRRPVEPTPAPASAPVSLDQAKIAAQPAAAAVTPQAGTISPSVSPAPKPTQPTVPLSERIWQTLLSERTLHVLLFLGIFLFSAAALSFVIWGWKDFSTPVRVAIPAAFTLAFFGLGWYIRTKTPMRRSGLALSAIAALLIPIDFYTIYVNFHVPADYWPLFWFITSVFCLVAYIIVALIIRSRLFGYLVGIAAGSTSLALIQMGHQTFGLSTDWRTAGLSVTALGLLLLATTFRQRGQFYFFAEAFRYLALLTVGVIMPLTFGWRYVNRHSYDTLHYALTINWWVGGCMFAWGALHYRSRSLGFLAALALPIATYLTQAALFNQAGINPAWHSFGLALLTPLYFITGYKLLARRDDPVFYSHGRTAVTWGIILLIVAAFWSLTDLTNGAAAAASHTVLALTVVMAALLWRRPGYLYVASLLSLSAATFAMTELNLTWAQLSVGWASLAIAHIIIALNVGNRFPAPVPNYARPLVIAGYVIAAAALLPPLFPYDGKILAYALGNWLGLSAWGMRLAHTNQPGFSAQRANGKTVFHWFTVLPLPFWVWLLFDNARPLDFTLPLALAVLSWALVLLSYRLERVNPTYRLPWSLVGMLVSIIAPVTAFMLVPYGLTPALTLLSAGSLYFTDALIRRKSLEFAPAGLVTAWGYTLFLNWWRLSFDAVSFGLALLIALYFLAGLWAERQKWVTRKFVAPLYVTTHLLSLVVIWRVYLPLFDRVFFDRPWPDEMRLWEAATQLLVGVVYGLYAWGSYRERWAHVAAWLGAASGGLLAFTYSTGRGTSAARVALLAIAFVLVERGLHWLRQRRIRNRQQAFIRLTWHLYRRPLLVTGWAMSAFAIGLALIRNLGLLGTAVAQTWAVIGLLLITGLYVLSARLFRQARFMWLAATLIFIPWTIATHLGWWTLYRPTLPGYALSWMILAWVLYLTSLGLGRFAQRSYVLPLKLVAHTLLPFALIWGIVDVDTSRFTFGLAIGLYGLAAILEHQHLSKVEGSVSAWRTWLLYPTVGLAPVWCVYLLAWLLPAARHEHYGLMLLAFGPLGLAAGQWLKRVAPKAEVTRSYALAGYLTGYGTLIVGTLLVAHEPSLRALALLFDAGLMLVSARLFKNSLWVYLAAVLTPLALLSALSAAGVPGNRYGWWLIGLASIYLLLTWVLRRVQLSAYASAMLAVGLTLIALGLPPSSQDQIGALYGYGAAALLYAITAFWLRQPILLLPACVLVVVPYAIGLQRSALPVEYYGLALLPGAVIALGLGWLLDYRRGAWHDFPWEDVTHWPVALAERWLNWWGLSLYTLGFGLAVTSPFFSSKASLLTLNFTLLMPLFGWAVYRFRRRLWLLALALSGHLAVVCYLEVLGWWSYPTEAWLRFLPVTLITAVVALFIEQYNHEDAPLSGKIEQGWSRPLYLLLLFDIVIPQLINLEASWAAVTITLTHALLLAVLASFWRSGGVVYTVLILSLVALGEWFFITFKPIQTLPVVLAELALGYGVVGYSLTLWRQKLGQDRALRPWVAVWELPLRQFSIGFSGVILLVTAFLGFEVVVWTLRAIFRLSFRNLVDLETVQMVGGVLALLGLLYLTVAFVQRRSRLGYMAMGMLLTGWMLHIFYVQLWDNLQWYALPAGLYLLGIAYLEWQRGNKILARWLDYLAMALMMGTLFWQTLLFGWSYGWEYALLLGAEGLLAIWWGSARRLRRFLYGGMVGVVLATVGQLINALWSINQWMVFGIIGLVVIITAIVIERKLEDIKAWQESEVWE